MILKDYLKFRLGNSSKKRLIEQLDENDKATIFSLVEKMLTNKKFKDFFAKNVASL
jgi:hypothetical protein